MIVTALPQLRHAPSKGVGGDLDKRFACAMEVLTPVFGMNESAFHGAENDCRGEAVVIAGITRFLFAFNEVFDRNEFNSTLPPLSPVYDMAAV